MGNNQYVGSIDKRSHQIGAVLIVISFFCWVIFMTNIIDFYESGLHTPRVYPPVVSTVFSPLERLFHWYAPAEPKLPSRVPAYDVRNVHSSVFKPLVDAHCLLKYCKEQSLGLSVVKYRDIVQTENGAIGLGGYNGRFNNSGELKDHKFHLRMPFGGEVRDYPKNLYMRNTLLGPQNNRDLDKRLFVREMEGIDVLFPFGLDFDLVMVADRDKHGKCRDDGYDNSRAQEIEGAKPCVHDSRFHTHLQRGRVSLSIDETKLQMDGEQSISGKYHNVDKVPLNSTYSAFGRGQELSDLCWHHNSLVSVCDSTGLVFTVVTTEGRLYPRAILADADGHDERALKAEWIQSQGSRLVVGGHGKEWVSNGKVQARGAEFVKVLEGKSGQVSSIDWKHVYRSQRMVVSAHNPGYLSHEAVIFNEQTNELVFLPRKVSRCDDVSICGYSDEADETKGASVAITVPGFNLYDVHERVTGDIAACQVYGFVNGSKVLLNDVWTQSIPPASSEESLATFYSLAGGTILDHDLIYIDDFFSISLADIDYSARHLLSHPDFSSLPPHMRAWALGFKVRYFDLKEPHHVYGFGAATYIPGSNLIAATRISEQNGATQTSLCVVDANGTVYTNPCIYVGPYKYEGIEIQAIKDQF